jgi:uncharacterized protein (TIGR03437 family)
MIVAILSIITLLAANSSGHRVVNAKAGEAAQCEYLIFPATKAQSFAARGGPGGVIIFSAENCTWTATSNAPWINLVSFGSGSVLGPGRLDYTVLANPEANQRTGTITVAGQTFTITQAGIVASSCAVTSINTGQSVNGSLAPGDCQSPLGIKNGIRPLADRYSFNATAGQSVIISATSPEVDTYLYLLDANGSVIAQNDGTAAANSRIPGDNSFLVVPASGTFIIEVTSFSSGELGEYALNLTTPSGNCTYGLNPTSQAFPAVGGMGTLSINTQAGCAWGAMSNNGWLSIAAAVSSGPGMLNYTVAANAGVARTGTLTVAGVTFTVTQAGTNGTGCPTIALVNPGNGAPGGAITITGTNFTGVTAVKFANNVAAQFTVVGDTQIMATVPNGAVTGPLTINKPTCPDTQTASFTVNRLVTSVSAANYGGTTLASESIVAAFGENLATVEQGAIDVPLPTSMAGTTVRIRDAVGVERLAPLFYISPGQINYQLPPGTATGTANATITNGNGVVSLGTINVATVAPGLFSADASGTGLAAAQVLRIKADGTRIDEPVVRYDVALQRYVAVPIDLGPESDQVFLVLYGTGIRFRSSLAATTVSIDGTNVEVLYAGEQSAYVGLDQVNARLSRSLIGKGEVSVVLTVDGRTANTLRINIK